MTTLKERHEINPKDQWDLTTIFESDDQFWDQFEVVKSNINKAEQFKTKLNSSSETLYEAITTLENDSQQLSKLYVYAHLLHDQDTSNSTYSAMENKVQSLAVQFSAAWSYFTAELLSIDESRMKEMIESHEGLQSFEFNLINILKDKPYTLSTNEEKILALASEPLSTAEETFSMFSNADIQFDDAIDQAGERHNVTQGSYSKLMESSDRVLRKNTYNSMYKAYGQYNHTLQSTLSGVVDKHIFSARVRGYDSSRHQALHQNRIDEVVYDQLIDAVNEHLPLLHRYTALRKELLQLDEMHMYDMYTPLVKDIDFKVTYEEAKEWLIKGLKPMGEDYLDIIKEGLSNGWVDVYENKGKRSGAYSSGSYLTNPFILMNWQDNVNNLFTLAHEFGHSAHSYLSRKHQPSHMSDYSIFVAEVASTCNEALLAHTMHQELTDPMKKLYLLNHELEGFKGTVFRQTMFAEFEHLIHQMKEEGTPLTADALNELYGNLNKKYYGDAVVTDENISKEWSRIPHFYYNFYVYQYATGYSAAIALSEQILSERQPAVDRYVKEMLSAGSSEEPLTVLKNAGVDMTSKEPIVKACKVFEQKLDEFEKLIKSL